MTIHGTGARMTTPEPLSLTNPSRPLVGDRRPGSSQWESLPTDLLVKLWTRVSSAIVKFGFRLAYADLEPPRTGIFNGREITIDPDVAFEMQCFILLHLFGHSVQWVAPSLAYKLDALRDTTDRDLFLVVLRDYEYEAAGYGQWLLHSVGLREFDAWYSDFVATDWRYVERYYREGRIPSWDECVVRGAPRITPLEIPPIELRTVEVRFAF